MKRVYNKMERVFEKLAVRSKVFFSSSITFLIANILMAYWLMHRDWPQPFTSYFSDIVAAITFISFFILQRSFSHFAQVIHLKLNELVAAHDNARNFLIKAEERTEEELRELEKEHIALISKYKSIKKKTAVPEPNLTD